MAISQFSREFFFPAVEASAQAVTIHADHIGPRLYYTCQFIFNQVLKVNFVLQHDLEEFRAAKGPRIHYGSQNLEGVFHIEASGLLDEKGIHSKKPDSYSTNNQVYAFKTKQGNLEFDVFSAVFYFISRYEEWQSFEADSHQRFEASKSWFSQSQSLIKPCVDIWINQFQTKLQQVYSEWQLPVKKWHIVSTVDVDNLFAYKAKSWTRLLGASLKDLTQLKFGSIAERVQVMLGTKPDPFDIYDEVSTFCNKRKIPLIYFFLQQSGTKFDRTVRPDSRAFKDVINRITSHQAKIGIHPSYFSINNPTLLLNEIKRLNTSASGESITRSRQHYLRFDIKTTPQQLLDAGITEDYTMGFASGPGFRAGTSFPFFYYDFHIEKPSNLLFIPFCAMDGVYTIYSKSNVDAAYNELLNLAQEVKKVGGYYITVFHERSFSNHLYPGFGSLYKKLHEHVIQLQSS